ncbi:hypothetical protein EVAR_27021_1 [Eumeta japonica]|uniref:Uncharacterized protein n=1 Tax=Eumeta variegata TaxID=151549 RepID=A0A4C1WG01_EUMVA|nr:hypothetical protein EVAR_27021_1 [Eumeta japonica]
MQVVTDRPHNADFVMMFSFKLKQGPWQGTADVYTCCARVKKHRVTQHVEHRPTPSAPDADTNTVFTSRTGLSHGLIGKEHSNRIE